MSLNLQKLVVSEASYEKLIKDVLEHIRKEKDMQAILKKVILFCKYAFSVNFSQRKKYLCLCLIRDISENIKIPEFQKVLDENVPIKLLKTIMNELSLQGKESKNHQSEQEYSQKMLHFAIETISFWTKKLSFLAGKSQFSEAYDELKKLKIQIPKNYQFYRMEKLTLGLWGDREENSEQYVKNEEMSPLISELFDKFTECKALIEERINEAVVNQEEIYLKTIIEKLRDFLLAFFAKYKNLQAETSLDRDVLVVYFHIANVLFKRISNRFYIPVQEMIALTKEIFEGDHNTEFSSVDRMDIINLAGIHKYNALTVFQRIHSRIETQEKKLGRCELTFEQKDVLVYANQKGVPAKPQREDDRRPKFKR